jgi:hypothetical protein
MRPQADITVMEADIKNWTRLIHSESVFGTEGFVSYSVDLQGAES